MANRSVYSLRGGASTGQGVKLAELGRLAYRRVEVGVAAGELGPVDSGGDEDRLDPLGADLPGPPDAGQGLRLSRDARDLVVKRCQILVVS